MVMSSGYTVPGQEICDEVRLCRRPLVSVCITTYNQVDYIDRALEGVLSQVVPFEYEVIVGDDASTDGTRERCLAWQARHPDKVRVVWWHENVSRFNVGNMRRVCERCRGAFVAFCDGDDYWTDARKLAKQVRYLADHPSCRLVFHPVIERRDEDARTASVFPPHVEQLARNGLSRSDLLSRNVIPMSSAMYRWDNPQAVLGDFPESMMPGDWKMHLLQTGDGEIGFINETMGVYRRNTRSVWNGNFVDPEWFRKYGCRNVLFYRWVQHSFGVNRRGVLRRLALATLAVSPQREELLTLVNPSKWWVRFSGLIAASYAFLAAVLPKNLRVGAERRFRLWSIVFRGRGNIFSAMAKKRYDVVFSLGGACSCSHVLRRAGLQRLSFPYDWVAGGSLKWRTNLLCSGFQNWFELKDLKEVPNLNHNPMRKVVNVLTGFLHNHDFDPSVRMDDAYPVVREKYKRRIARLFALADSAKRILVVWICNPGSFAVTEGEIIDAHAKLARRFPHAVVDMTVFSLSSEPFALRKVRMLNPQVKWIAYDYRNRQPVASQWAVDISGIAKLLRDCKVREYRSLREFGTWYDPRAVVHRVMAKVMSRGKERIDFLYRQRVWREPLMKIGGLQTLAAAVSELCLGSSHAHYGYLALEGCYNLGEISCDAYYSMQILRYWMPRLPQLRRVVYFYDIFTPGSVLDKSPEAFRRIPWLDRYGISPLIRDCREDTTSGDAYCRCEAAYKAYVHRGLCRMPKRYCGNAIRRCPMPGVILEKRVATHLALNKGDCDRYVNEMASLCREKDIELILVVPPLRSDYLRSLPEGFRVTVPTGLKSLDLMYDKRFNDDDFTDWDHLSAKGAAKLTSILHGEINGVSTEAPRPQIA